MRVKTPWDEQEALGQTANLLADCSNKGCWALRVVLDEIIESVGPSWVAHFLATAKNKPAAEALASYITTHWPAYAQTVQQMIASTNWSKETDSIAKEFGDD
jgi:hypothetical protein